MQQKKLINHFNNLYPYILISLIAFFINYHYGFVGLMPMDNTVLYNGGYRVLKGFTPFNDYWLVTGPILDYLTAFFFYIFGISWKSFIIHSSTFNLILSLGVYHLLTKLGLKKFFSIFYAILVAILFYPVVGTPFVDHHSTFFLILAYFYFAYSCYYQNPKYFRVIPIIFCLAFLAKQTPSIYGLFGMFFLISIYCIIYRNFLRETLLNFVVGTLIAIAFVVLFFFLTGINIKNFFDQYIFFASSIGEYRFSNYQLSLMDVFVKFKFINIFNLSLIFLLFFYYKKFEKYKNDFFLILIFLTLSLTLIFHQFYTLNQNFIFFLIPLLCSIVHFSLEKNFKKKKITILLILVCIFAVGKYHLRFNEQRKFNELENVNLNLALNSDKISKDLKDLKWITYEFPDNPKKELEGIKDIMNIISKEKQKKMIITDYQFIAPSLRIYDNSPNQWHHPGVSFPLSNNNYFEEYKKFFVNIIFKKELKVIYETINEKENTITGLILDKDCFNQTRVHEMMVKLELSQNCEDFN